VYRTEIADIGPIVHEVVGSTDRAAWCTRAELDAMPLVQLGRIGVRLAFGDVGVS
jgi:hypothetical protein